MDTAGEAEREPRRPKLLSRQLLTYLRRVERLIADDAFSSDEGASLALALAIAPPAACHAPQATGRHAHGIACNRTTCAWN